MLCRFFKKFEVNDEIIGCIARFAEERNESFIQSYRIHVGWSLILIRQRIVAVYILLLRKLEVGMESFEHGQDVIARGWNKCFWRQI